MLELVEALLALIVFTFGACIFSFLNVVIYRVPKKISFVKGFSACPSCGHRLYGKDMVPILSWLLLKGKCRYCGAKVSARYTLVELMGGTAALLSVHFYGYSASAVLVFAFLCMMTVVTFVDMDTMEIPDEFHIVTLIIAVLSIFFMPEITIVERLIGFVCVSVPMLIIDFFVPGGFGGGDIKLMAPCGLFLGWKLCLLSFFLGILSGGFYGIYLLAAKKTDRKGHFAFGPFLCLGMTISVFVGNALLGWYIGLIPGL